MFTITVRYDEKQSTSSQYENVTAGVLIERSHLELHTADELLQKTQELFALARTAVQQELARQQPPVPVSPPARRLPPPGNGNARPQGQPNGQGPRPNGNGRRYGRPDPEPTPKQKALLHRIATDRHLGPETIRDICERLVGQPPEQLDRRGMSKLLEILVNGEVAA